MGFVRAKLQRPQRAPQRKAVPAVRSTAPKAKVVVQRGTNHAVHHGRKRKA